MRERLANTPNYTCVLEIDRTQPSRGRAARSPSTEIARLEIGVVGGREHFAWPGDRSTQSSLEDLLGPGLSSTGEFSAHGRSTFLDPRSTIERLPDERQTEAGLTGYAYRVPLAASRYAVSTGEKNTMAAYEGELWLRPDSGELERFEVRVPAPPPGSGLQRIDSLVEYAPREVSGRPAWLPARARIEVQSTAGRVFRNDLRFLDCRAFQADSTIRFDEASLEAVKAAGPVSNAVVPPGLELRIELQTAFDSEHARAGDRFEARLLEEVGNASLALPEGASVAGRIRRLALMSLGASRGPGRQTRRVATLTLELLEVSWNGRCGRLTGTLEAIEKIPKMVAVNPDALQLPQSFYNSTRALGYRSSRRMSAKGFGTFVLLGDVYRIPQGARMRWRTEEPPAEPCAPR